MVPVIPYLLSIRMSLVMTDLTVPHTEQHYITVYKPLLHNMRMRHRHHSAGHVRAIATLLSLQRSPPARQGVAFCSCSPRMYCLTPAQVRMHRCGV
jgi:hypothetical protein